VTIALIVMCLVVGALELYAARRSRNQADTFQGRIDELRRQVDKQSGILLAVGEQLTTELARITRDVLPDLESRLRRHATRVEQLGELIEQADQYIKAQAMRMHELEQQKIILSALRRKLTDVEAAMSAPAPSAAPPTQAARDPEAADRVETALTRISELEHSGDQTLELHRDLARALEDVADVVAGLLQFTSAELDGAVTTALTGRSAEEVTVAGRLWSSDPDLRDILVRMYERCVRAGSLGIRFKTTDGGPERLRYFLSGSGMAELARSYAALLIAINMHLEHPGGRPPDHAAALRTLLRTLYESSAATGQIGPLIMVRTPEELLCGVLRHAQGVEFERSGLLWDPVAAARRLRGLPAHQVWDLTAWAAQPPDA
jgi:hypothetical protein